MIGKIKKLFLNRIYTSNTNNSVTSFLLSKKDKTGISMLYLLILIIIILILASSVIIVTLTQNPIGSANETSLKSKMQTMIEEYDLRYKDLYFDNFSDDSKIKDEDFSDIIKDEDKDEYEATKEGVIYTGDDEKTKEIAREMGLIIKGEEGGKIERLILDSTTRQIAIQIKMSIPTDNVDTITYYISQDGNTWDEYTSKEEMITIDRLKHNTNFKVKADVLTTQGETESSKEYEIKTKELLIGSIYFNLDIVENPKYDVGTWTNKSVIVNVNQSSTGKTTYKVDGLINETDTSNKIENQGTYNVDLVTTDGYNVLEEAYSVKIDKTNPTTTIAPNGGSYVLDANRGMSTIKTRITAKDTGGSNLKEVKYAWSTSNTVEPTNWIDYNANGEDIVKNDATEGNWYLWTKVIDNATNRAEQIKVSNAFSVNGKNTGIGQITLIPDITDWTNKNVTVKVIYGDNLTENRKAGFGSANVANAESVVVTQNGTVYAEATDSAGNKAVSTLKITNIDKVNPTGSFNPNGGTYVMKVGNTTYNIISSIASSDDLSGVSKREYAWSTSNTTAPTSGWASFSDNTSLTYKSTGGTIYLWGRITDKAGNISNIVSNAFNVNYQVLYDANTGTNAPAEQVKIHNQNLTLSTQIPKKDTYTFLGWSKTADGNKEYDAGGVYSENKPVKLYAVWTPDVYSVSVNPNGGTWNNTTNVTVIEQGHGTTRVIEDPIPHPDYKVSFDTDGGNQVAQLTSKITFTNWTVTGPGRLNGNVYTFGIGDGTLTANYTNALVTLPSASKTGYIFDGWYTQKSGGQKIGDAGATYRPTGDITLYAHWRAKQIEVTFYRNLNSSDTTTAKQTFTYGVTGQSFSNKNWSKTGYTLKGWSTNRNATTAEYSTLSSVADSWINENSPSITLYAVWVDDIAPTISGPTSSSIGVNGFTVSATVSDNGSGTNRIVWYYKKSSESSYKTLTDTWTATTNSQNKTRALTGLTNNTTYNVYAIVYDAAGNSKQSNTISVKTLLAVAMTNTTEYASLQAAFNAVPTNNASTSVKMLQSVTESATLTANRNANFNLNGKTITGTTTNNGTMTISGSGTMTRSNGSSINNSGNLTLNGGTIMANASYWAVNSTGGTVTVDGATIKGDTTEDLMKASAGTINVKSGTLSLSGPGKSNAIYTIGSASFNISGGTITGSNTDTSSLIKHDSSGTASISGGTMTKTTNNTGASVLYLSGTGTINISGGSIISDYGTAIDHGSSGTINISNSANIRTNCKGGYAAAITVRTNGKLYIKGGTIRSEAGIAVNNYRNGYISMTGGTVTSNASGYQTIFCTSEENYSGAVGNVDIYGGRVENTGGGAAIAVNYYGYLTVYGGTITSRAVATSADPFSNSGTIVVRSLNGSYSNYVYRSGTIENTGGGPQVSKI